MKHPPEPTADQCDENYEFSWHGKRCMAAWYPQMGGYVGKAIVIPCADEPEPCFDVYVWHDGMFPFSEDREPEVNPVYLHHCLAKQFITFGQELDRFGKRQVIRAAFEVQDD